MKRSTLGTVFAVMSLGGCVTTDSALRQDNASAAVSAQPLFSMSKAEMYDLTDRVYGTQPVPVEIFIPKDVKPPYPLIIYQHGSSRDGFVFEGKIGKSDEHGSRLKKAALESGFAFAALDAYEGKGLTPSSKRAFPKAEAYAIQLRRKLLAKYPELDHGNTFYSGFSYGGDAVMNQLYPPFEGWRALVAAEPSCNVVAEPKQIPFPLLILKGTKSHYYPIACELVAVRHEKAGNPVKLSLLQGGNHYFSLNGEIIYNGIAFNGCSKNPIFIDGPTLRRYDGTLVDRSAIDTCFTREGGKGQSRELLNDAISQTIAFFNKHRRTN